MILNCVCNIKLQDHSTNTMQLCYSSSLCFGDAGKTIRIYCEFIFKYYEPYLAKKKKLRIRICPDNTIVHQTDGFNDEADNIQ